MKLLSTMIKTSIGFGARDVLCIVPAARNDKDQCTANKHDRRHEISPMRGGVDGRKSRNEAIQRDRAKEQGKWQAEDDRVVLLCRD